MFRTRPFTPSSKRIGHGLLRTLTAFGLARDGTSRNAGLAYPAGGTIVRFSELHVLVMLVPDEYPSMVLTFSNPPQSTNIDTLGDMDNLYVRVEVLAIRSSTSPVRGRAAVAAHAG
ncbi:DNA mismatch repair protein Mlh1 [Hordeum vulgare]|nr:DNA mismatch repair protein Mlh1 [Hordeum vulgare]